MRCLFAAISGKSQKTWLMEKPTTPNHVAEAFYKRDRLIQLRYAQEVLVVSVKSIEVLSNGSAIEFKNDAAAIDWANRNAQIAFREEHKPLGNLVSSRCMQDTLASRALFGIADSYRASEHAATWTNAA